MYEIFEQLLQSHGISAYKFCKETGVSQSTISTWKKKNSKCGMDLAEIVANYFNVSIDYLMNGGDTKTEITNHGYYIDEEAAKTAQEIYNNDKILFDVYKTVDKERLVEFAKKLAELRKLEEGEE
nr:helix-turn-helix transcriptional regulator [uncultured Mediterraneibacter sp.]